MVDTRKTGQPGPAADHGDREHALLSPSSSYRWLNCPGSKHAPETGTNPKAEAGTRAHELVEEAMAWYCRPVHAMTLEGQVYEATIPLVTKDQAISIARAASEYADVLVEAKARSGVEECLIETKAYHPEILDFWGTIDCMICDDGLELYDLKTGVWPAHPEQLACYALLAIRTFPADTDSVVKATIVQPRAKNGDTRPYFEWTYDDLSRFEERIRLASESDERHPGDWCAFCGFRPACQTAEASGAPDRISGRKPFQLQS